MTLPIQHLFSEQTENPSITLLKQLFPQCFDKNGAFLPEKMAELMPSAGVDVSREAYSLNWLGKSYARYLRDCNPTTLLNEDQPHNSQPQNQHSQNLLIKGDNLEVLKHLKNAYANKVKMIYIDPPYNTGSDGFVYQDDRKFTPEQLAKLANMPIDEAKRVLDFTAKKSNSHSAWLTFMYPRLYIARELLKEDGVIFISIDDNEQAQLKLLCDEVFGEENFVAGFIWNNKYTVSNDTDVSYQHEHIFCYAKDKANFSLNLLERTAKQNKDYKNRDNDPKGAWKATPIHARSGTDSGIYTIVFPNGIEWTAPTGRYPRYSKAKLQELYDEGALYFNKNGGVDKKTYLSEVRDGITCGTVWSYEDVGHSHGNNEELADLLGKGIFNDPKGIMLIEKLLKLSTSANNKDIVLDFFAGSGTTAHAVFNANKFDGNRKFILVQLDEPPKKEAYKAGYQTIFDITKARIEKSAVKIQQDFPDYQGDLGCKIFEMVPNFRLAQEDENLSPQMALPDSLNANLSEEQYHTLLTTWRVFDGNALTDSVQAVKLGDYLANLCGHTLYFIQAGFDSLAIKALIEKLDKDKAFLPERIVLFGANVESAKQKELKQALDSYTNRKKLNIALLVRY
ncbi:site-specific DNA-methyltransferase [Pasteurella dagmatis]|uniref:site-specific DNA-methyltransferase (adenine-specific) n=1 Tax=Pasteurella dagmatis ATCC 43325 TaxID=667128 RepID=C9PP42_9PAST|nr:DNA methyltransferase [Pasteurella dagmatis]EEX50672.1 DNA (cytosine-5-)-methyltransferase [Pasteurella dagmatis ATCC 43325]SNV79352.1 type III restriction-modification system EcoP15I [Pasteurella dagmatis]